MRSPRFYRRYTGIVWALILSAGPTACDCGTAALEDGPGSIVITVSGSGAGSDPDGLIVQYDGQDSGTAAGHGTSTTNPRAIEVAAGGATDVRFTFACS